MTKKLNSIFYVGLVISFVLFLLPPKYVMGVYTLNYLGWFWLLACLPITGLVFLGASFQDFKDKKWRKLATRSIIFVVVLATSVGYWLYQAHELGNL